MKTLMSSSILLTCLFALTRLGWGQVEGQRYLEVVAAKIAQSPKIRLSIPLVNVGKSADSNEVTLIENVDVRKVLADVVTGGVLPVQDERGIEIVKKISEGSLQLVVIPRPVVLTVEDAEGIPMLIQVYSSYIVLNGCLRFEYLKRDVAYKRLVDIAKKSDHP